jgi:hypothetical protein
MKEEYDFSKGKRGAIEIMPPGKVRITIRIDNGIIDWFRKQTETSGGGSYQTLINDALKEYIMRTTLESMFRHVLREEIPQLICHTEPRIPIYSQTASSENERSNISILNLKDTASTSIDRRRFVYGGN